MRRLIRDVYAIGDSVGRSLNGMSANQATAVVAMALTFCLALGAAPACGSTERGVSGVPSASGAEGTIPTSSGETGGATSAPSASGRGAAGSESGGSGADGSAVNVAGLGAGAAASGAASGGEAGAGGAATSGAAGTGGAVDGCSNTTWCATGSCVAVDEFVKFCEADPPAQAIDGNPLTRYTSGDRQNGTEEFSVLFPTTVTISGIGLTVPYALDAPAAYAVEYSTDGSSFAPFEPPVTGNGTDELTQPSPGISLLSIGFPPTAMKAVKVKQTGEKAGWWSILELTVVDCVTD